MRLSSHFCLKILMDNARAVCWVKSGRALKTIGLVMQKRKVASWGNNGVRHDYLAADDALSMRVTNQNCPKNRIKPAYSLYVPA
jgi:hypothetical protein